MRTHKHINWRVLYRLAQGQRATDKRQPPVPLPIKLLSHLRRWVRKCVAKDHFVEFNGRPVLSVKTGFASAVRLAELSTEFGNVSPHTLRALAYAGPFFLSACERGDPEMYALIQMKLARGWQASAGGIDLWVWDVSPVGRALADQFLERPQQLLLGPSWAPAPRGA